MSNNQLHLKNKTTINHQLFLHASKKYGYGPLSSKALTPNFHLTGYEANAIKVKPDDRFISLQHFFDTLHPLVIIFYSDFEYGSPASLYLQQLHKQIQLHGGKLLVITNEIIHPHHRNRVENLTIFVDEDNTIAHTFGLFNPDKPIWTWLSGIEADQAIIPAVYVITPYREIIFSHIDCSFSLYTKGNLSNDITNSVVNAVDDLYVKFIYQEGDTKKTTS